MPDAIGEAKRELRRRMRAIRDGVDDVEVRSARLWSRVQDEPAVRAAGVVMAFASLPGEPPSAPFIEWCRDRGKAVVVPDAAPTAQLPADLSSIDVVIVPGLAFTSTGDRLGQGGGWYDRLLSEVRADCVSIGVCFAAQVVDELPREPHDVAVDILVTDEARVRCAESGAGRDAARRYGRSPDSGVG